MFKKNVTSPQNMKIMTGILLMILFSWLSYRPLSPLSLSLSLSLSYFRFPQRAFSLYGK